MKFNGSTPLAHPSNSTAASAHGDAPPLSAADVDSFGYTRRRQQRLAERLRKAGGHTARWNHLISVVVGGSDADDIAALPRTLGSLLAQRYRNFEVLITGLPDIRPADTGYFTSCRGLFSEPAVDVLDLLSDPATDSLWRGSHLIVAHAGDEFDPDAIELFNAALDHFSDAGAPAIVVCGYEQLPQGSDDRAPNISPEWNPDVTPSLDKIRTAFMVSRTLLPLARRQLQRPRSLQDWQGGIATMTPSPNTVHIAETLIHSPRLYLPARPPQSEAQ